MSEPRTKAGCALLAREVWNSRSFALITPEAIVAIEDEAARLDVDRLDQAWRNVMTRGDFGTFVGKAHWQDVAAEYERLASPTPATPEVE